jgi:hypothetical protein
LHRLIAPAFAGAFSHYITSRHCCFAYGQREFYAPRHCQQQFFDDWNLVPSGALNHAGFGG